MFSKGILALWNKILSVVLVVTVLGALGMLVYAVATPKVGERFTEFYILDSERKAHYYPKELTLGAQASVVLGIVNREQEPVVYRAEIKINREIVGEIERVSLNHEEKWNSRCTKPPKASRIKSFTSG